MMPGLTETTIFRVDFNSVDPDSWLVLGAISDASPPRRPDLGERVWLVDGEGNGCAGIVRLVEDEIVHFELEEATWTQGETLSFNGIPKSAWVAFSGDRLASAC
jgi:hypothetical protein